MIDELDYKYVLAMDPGGTTGIAMLRYTDDTQPELIYLHQQEKGVAGFYDFFHGTKPNDDVTIVSESFTIREGVHGADVTPLRIEGMQYEYWQDEVVYQDPSMKSMVSDGWLKSQNLWTPGKRHQMDALIHAFVYLRNEMHRPTLESMSGRSETPIAEPGEAQSAQLEDSFDGSAAQVEGAQETFDETELTEAEKEILKAMAVFEQMFGGEYEQEQQSKAEAAAEAGRPQPAEGSEGAESGEGEGEEADGEGGDTGGEYGEGEPTGSGGRGKELDKPDEPTLVFGERRKRSLNGAFTGFDEE